MNPDYTIYSLSYCPYCVRAKRLLDDNGIPYREIVVAADDDCTRAELEEKSGMKTFPQIFYGHTLVGGFTELKALDDQHGIKNWRP